MAYRRTVLGYGSERLPDVNWEPSSLNWGDHVGGQIAQVAQMFQAAHERQKALARAQEQEQYERQQNEIENARKAKALEFDEQRMKLDLQTAKATRQKHELEMRAKQEAEALKQGELALASNQAGQDDYFNQGPTAENQMVQQPPDVNLQAVAGEDGGPPVIPERTLSPIEYARQMAEQRKYAAAEERGEKVADIRATTAERLKAEEPFKVADFEREQKAIRARERAAEDRVYARQAAALDKETRARTDRVRAGYLSDTKKLRDGLSDLDRFTAPVKLQIEAGKQPTPADEFALIYAFNKALDPNSVVRESEFANTKTVGAGVTQQAFLLLQKWNDGKQLTQEQIGQMMDTISRARSASDAALKERRDFHYGVAVSNGLDPTMIFGEERDDSDPAGIR
jgi:hypothetical protein